MDSQTATKFGEYLISNIKLGGNNDSNIIQNRVVNFWAQLKRATAANPEQYKYDEANLNNDANGLRS